MTDWAVQGISSDSQILPKRLSAFLKRQGSAKQLSLRLGVDLRTMTNLRGGLSWPIARHWWSIWVEFGDDVIEAVFNPDRVEARLKREAEERAAQRQQRLASSALVEPRAFSVGLGLAEGGGADEEPAELEPGPPNLDLFEGADR